MMKINSLILTPLILILICPSSKSANIISEPIGKPLLALYFPTNIHEREYESRREQERQQDIRQQQHEENKKIRQLAIELTSKRDYLGLGNLYYSNGYMRDAIEAYSKAIEANPRDSESYFLRARVKGDQNDLSGAIADYSSVISLSPESDGAYVNRALDKYRLEDKNGSLQDFRSAARIYRATGNIVELKKTMSRIQKLFKVPE
jgi:tetratricopeptide (TPR) repeat protein